MGRLFDLENKTVLIIAGTSPIGYAMAEGLAEFGARVVITSRDISKAKEASKRLSEKYNIKSESYALDFDGCDGNEKEVSRIFSEIAEKNKGLDVLINNAASAVAKRVTDMDYASFTKGLDSTINGVFLTTKEALKLMLPRKSGSIINISSMYGIVSPDPGIYSDLNSVSPANYGAGKAAIIQFTKYIACNYGMEGIRANSICPGPFPREEARQNTEFMEKLEDKTALKRLGRPEDIKGIAVLLASDASSYITGQNYCVDGGWSAW